MLYKVFISSTDNDIEIARDLAQRLEAAGVRVFPVEKTAVAGETILTTVNRALREADEVIMVLTRDSAHSPALVSELGMAMALQKRVAPLLVNLTTQELPPMFRQLSPLRYADLPGYISTLAARASLPKAG